jgi:uncharacterized protein DUF3303
MGYNVAMLFMVIEQYTDGPEPVYQRAAERGRMLPDGLRYIDSWIVDDGGLDRCFQLMETADPGLLDVWRDRWADIRPGPIGTAPRSMILGTGDLQ